jgi:CAAX protease family protein
MNAVISWLRAYWLALFAALACLFGWVFFIARALGADVTPDGMPLGPIIAAAIVAAVLGRAGLREWGRWLVTFRTSLGWYALALVAPVAIISAAALTNYALGAPLPTPAQLAGWTELPGTFATFLILVGIGEEAGRTAFAAPRLLDRYPFLTAWAILSAIRVLWHVPLMLSGGLPWVLGIGGNIAFQFLVLWIFRRSGRVWFLAAIWHAMLNATGGQFFFRMVQGPDQARLAVLMTAGYVLVALTAFLVDRRRPIPAPAAN